MQMPLLYPGDSPCSWNNSPGQRKKKRQRTSGKVSWISKALAAGLESSQMKKEGMVGLREGENQKSGSSLHPVTLPKHPHAASSRFVHIHVLGSSFYVVPFLSSRTER
ncbi:hypothetical protein XENOCAPTIV_018806 [Xenoophorus captivus]|uniref:Uncharacterized protein n=1 Tax=Xenoophorus captivus TaxID=1517983 RepID=A0ABV0RL36_9TELE